MALATGGWLLAEPRTLQACGGPVRDVRRVESGVSAAFPALNYRTEAGLREAIQEIKSASAKPFGVNLIVNRSNPKYKAQLRTLLPSWVDQAWIPAVLARS